MASLALKKHVFVLAFCIFTLFAANGQLITIHITNNLPPAQRSFVTHCKSNVKDLGFQEVPIGGAYDWSFRAGEANHLTCALSSFTKFGAFNVYDDVRDKDRCPTKCVWDVKEDGVYGFKENDVTKNDIFFEWPAKTPPQRSIEN